MEKIHNETEKRQHLIKVAAGKEKADLVLKNTTYVNVFSNELSTGDIAITQDTIAGIGNYEGKQEIDMSGKIVLPGFIDGHIHLESGIVSPVEFVKAVLPHGTTTVITDPHEIANVMGSDGIRYMLQATEGIPLDVRFMIPSCVPATPLDEAGATLDSRLIEELYDNKRVIGLAEMMDFVGTVNGNEEITKKINSAVNRELRVDGHAPKLSGKELNAYVAAGITSDHECATFEEALEKLTLGQMIMIREGTAAHNLEALMPLLNWKYANRCMFCTDDKHPSDLIAKGHMDYIVKKAIELGAEPILAVKAASANAAKHFGLRDRGAIAPSYLADLVIIDNFHKFNVLQVYKNGQAMINYDVAGGELSWVNDMENVGKPKLIQIVPPIIEEYLKDKVYNTFDVETLSYHDFEIRRPKAVLGVIPGEIITTDEGYSKNIDVENDILKIAVIERHKNTGHIGLGFLKGYGLKSGAIATSVSHDSHNIIVVGTNDEDMAFAANKIINDCGGIVVVNNGQTLGNLKLSIAGLMSDMSLEEVNWQLDHAKQKAIELGINEGIDPFMTLSFMSLPVIPKLRLTTRGVFDVESQSYV